MRAAGAAGPPPPEVKGGHPSNKRVSPRLSRAEVWPALGVLQSAARRTWPSTPFSSYHLFSLPTALTCVRSGACLDGC